MAKKISDFCLKNIRLFFLAIVAIAQTACSTPPVVEREVAPDETWDAYISCIQYHFGGNQRICDDVSTTNAFSYNQYFFQFTGITGTTGPGSNYGTGGRFRGAVKNLEPLFEQAYKEYLAALPAAERAELAAKWRALAQQEQ